MIQASSDLYNYFNQPIRTGTQTLEILINKGSKTYVVREDSLVQGSVSIERKSVSGSSFDIGEVYVDFLTFTINKDISQYTQLINAKCTVNLTVQTDTLYDSIKLGTFIIKQSGIKKSKSTIKITADSFMCRFDKSLKRKKLKGNLYYLVNEACSKCNVVFGMTQYDFEALNPNTLREYEIKEKSAIKTYRDILMYAAQLIGGFATVNNEDELVFGIYKNSNDKCNVNNNVIVDYSTGDETYQLNGIQMSLKDVDLEVSRSGASDSFWLSLDSNPLLSNISDLSTLNTIMSNIWDNLYNISMNNFNFKFNGNPLIQCGDIISIHERSLETYASSYKWVFHGKEEIGCVSVDDRKKTQTQTQKKVDSLESDSGEGGEPVADELVEKITQENTRTVHKKFTTTATIQCQDVLQYVIPEANDIGDILIGDGYLNRSSEYWFDYDYVSYIYYIFGIYSPITKFNYTINNFPNVPSECKNFKLVSDFSSLKGRIKLSTFRRKNSYYDTDDGFIEPINERWGDKYRPCNITHSDNFYWVSGSDIRRGSYTFSKNVTGDIVELSPFRDITSDYSESTYYINYNKNYIEESSTLIKEQIDNTRCTNTLSYGLPKPSTSMIGIGEIDYNNNLDIVTEYSESLKNTIEVNNRLKHEYYQYLVPSFKPFMSEEAVSSHENITTPKTTQQSVRDYTEVQAKGIIDLFVSDDNSFLDTLIIDSNYDRNTNTLTKTIPVTIEYDIEESYQATATDAGQKIQDTADKTEENTASIEETNKKLADLTTKYNKLKSTVSTQKTQIDSMNTTISSLQKNVTDLLNRVYKLEHK